MMRLFIQKALPAMLEQHAVVSQSASDLRAADRSWVPQFNLEAAGYGRGTGAETNGQRLAGANGLAPTVGNYAVGLNVTFGFLDFANIHAREESQTAILKAGQSRETLNWAATSGAVRSSRSRLKGDAQHREEHPHSGGVGSNRSRAGHSPL